MSLTRTLQVTVTMKMMATIIPVRTNLENLRGDNRKSANRAPLYLTLMRLALLSGKLPSLSTWAGAMDEQS